MPSTALIVSVRRNLLRPVFSRREVVDLNAACATFVSIRLMETLVRARGMTKALLIVEQSSRWSVLGTLIYFFRRTTIKNLIAIALLSTAIVSGAADAQQAQPADRAAPAATAPAARSEKMMLKQADGPRRLQRAEILSKVKAPPKRGFFLLPPLSSVPGVDLLLGLVFGITIPLLQTAFELVLLAIYDIKVIIGKLPPLFFNLALHLLPITFNAIPIHAVLQFGAHDETFSLLA